MSNKSKNIKLNEKKIIEEQARRDIFMAELGNLLISNNISFPDDEETVRQVNELKRDIKKIKSEQDKISQYRKRIDSIVADEKNALRKIKEIKGDNEKHFIGIGETVFSIYMERPDELYDIREYLDELIELNDKIDEIDEKIENSERKKDAEGFFGKLIVTGSGTVLESKKKMLESRYVALYKAAGRKLCDDRYFDKTEDKEIHGIFSAFEANLKVVEDFEIKLDSLKAEKSNYQIEIDEKNKELNTEYNKKPDDVAADREAELNGILLSAGRGFYDVLKSEEAPVTVDNDDIAGCIEKIEKSESETDLMLQENEKLAREIDIENKQIELEKLRETIQVKQDKVKSVKKEIDKMNRAAKKLEKEIEDLQ